MQSGRQPGSALELVTIGTELLLGFTVDTNGAQIARAMAAVGIEVVRRTSVSDRPEEIRSAVEEALVRTGVVLTTGGLGPTRDDISKKVVADLFGVPLDFDEDVWRQLVERFARIGRTPAASNRSQAEVPRGAAVLRNRWGTAPGLWLEGAAGVVIMLPGVPGEMRKLLEHEVVPRLAARSSGIVTRSRQVRTTGIPESTLAERMGNIERDIAPLTLAYLPGLDGVDLRVSAWQLSPEIADERLAAACHLLIARGGEHVYGEGDADLAELVLAAARGRGVKIATAESCTGGLVGARLTEVPGSSDAYVGGVVAYANDLKIQALGVDPATIAAHGAVSEQVATAMARGALERLGADVAISVTGIAGPGGGSDEKPVGTVWFGVAYGTDVTARRSLFPGSRHDIRARAAQAALHLLLRRLQTEQP
ncbi:MAG TPA: competence/damage-inducible protein A [Gemmatimonadales bacterium]|nr:competence/damage-inducible protein A [Gemmatimonadales bacterium]